MTSLNDHSLKIMNRIENGTSIASPSVNATETGRAFAKLNVTVNARQSVTMSVTQILNANVTLRNVTNLMRMRTSGSWNWLTRQSVAWVKLFFAKDPSTHH